MNAGRGRGHWAPQNVTPPGAVAGEQRTSSPRSSNLSCSESMVRILDHLFIFDRMSSLSINYPERSSPITGV